MSFIIYLISLPEDEQRRASLRKRFPSSFDGFRLIPGTVLKDAKQLTSEFKINSWNKDMTLPELGCAISHVRALEDFIKSNATHALIIEDDIIGSDQEIIEIEENIKQLPSNSFLLCGGQEGLRGEKYNYGKRTVMNDVFFIPRYLRKFYTRACCYCVTRDAALHILHHQRKRLYLTDDWGFYFKKWKNFYFTKKINHPLDLSDSHLEKSRQQAIPKGELARIKRDGMRKIFSRFFSKILAKIHRKFNLLEIAK